MEDYKDTKFPQLKKLELKCASAEDVPQIAVIIPESQPKTFKEFFDKIRKERFESQKDIEKQFEILKESNK